MTGATMPSPLWERPTAGVMLFAWLLAVGCYLPAAPGGATPNGAGPGAAPPEGTTPAPGDVVEAFVERLNAERARTGCPPLAWDSLAGRAAHAHSRDMRDRGYFSHVTPEGHGLVERLAAHGVAFTAAAENIAYGARTGEQVFRQWEGSAGHRANMLNCRYRKHGVGLVGVHWTHVLFTP